MRPSPVPPCALVLSSCVLGAQPGSPEYGTPDSFRGDQAPHGTSFGDKSWRKVFADSTLRSIIQRALKNKPDLAAVASTDIGLKSLDERLRISQDTAKSREISLELVTARRDGGVSSDLEVGRAQALLGT